MLNTISGLLSDGVSPIFDFDSIATVTVGSGGASTITFSGIPSGYSHLQVRGIIQGLYTSNDSAGALIRFNSDTGANYATHRLYGNGTGAFSSASTSGTFIEGPISLVTPSSSSFSPNVIDILDYANTSKYKTVRSLGGYDINGTGIIGLYSGLWQSTSAITTITITSYLPGITVFNQYSTFALYGIK
jgi:hypothetical protein